MPCCAALFFPLSAEPQYDTVIRRGGLHNTFTKLNSGEEISIVFLGGSVTDAGIGYLGYSGWRDIVTSWFKDRYPGKIKDFNAGIPGTGSTKGLERFDSDVLARDPDLVFVEFAVNDEEWVTIETIANNYKGMVSKGWQKNPVMDFCFVETIAWYSKPLYSGGQMPHTVVAHYQVADFYKVIPSVNVGWALYQQIGPNKSWESLTKEGDRVHPNEEGNKIYGRAVLDLLEIEKHATGATIPHSLDPNQAVILPAPSPPVANQVEQKPAEPASSNPPAPIPLGTPDTPANTPPSSQAQPEVTAASGSPVTATPAPPPSPPNPAPAETVKPVSVVGCGLLRQN